MVPWRPIIKLAVVAAVLVITAYVSYLFGVPPHPDCTTTVMGESWTKDRAYKATLLKRDCNLGESLFYSVRIDAYSPPLRDAWFTIRELENDESYPRKAPVVTWLTERQLEIVVATKMESGRLVERVGDDLTVIRTFDASSPDVFLNLGH